MKFVFMEPIGGENKSQPMHGSSMRPHRVMARMTSGKTVLPNGDGRTVWARRLRDLIALMTIDAGGDDLLTEGQRALIRRAAVLTVECERMEVKFANDDGTPKMLEEYGRATNTLRRTLETVGLRRVPRDITPPTLRDYIDGNGAQR
jgi:hypothetical protein